MHRARAAAGFTLAELMIVVALIGILLGLGVASIDRVDPGARGLQTTIESFVQSTRDRARSSGQPVSLRYTPPVETTAGQFFRDVFRRRLEANFEPMYEQREGVQLTAPASLGKSGRYGAGLDCGQGGGAQIVGRLAGGSFVSPRGVQIEFDVRVDELEGGKLLVWKDLTEIELKRDGGLSFVCAYGDGETSTDLQVDAPAGALRKGRWHHLRVIALSGLMAIEVDGERLVEREAIGEIQSTDHTPYLGDPDGRFSGAFDEFVVWGRATEPGPTHTADQDVFVGALELVFDSFGRLDPQVHEEAVPIRIASAGVEVGAFQVGVFTEEILP